METPKVNAVGLVEYPDDYVAAPRSYGRGLRVAALLFLCFFAAVTVGSTVLSLGAYCLTSDGGDTRALRSSPLVIGARDAAPESRGIDAAEAGAVTRGVAESSVTSVPAADGVR
ncbi:MAG: hypothetical protein AAGF23_22230 [Acidobacteriota bacterium]